MVRGQPSGIRKRVQAVHCSVRSRVSALCCIQGVVVARGVANASVWVRFPVDALRRRAALVSAVVCKTTKARFDSGARLHAPAVGCSVRISNPRRPGSTPGGSATSRSSRRLRKLGSHPSNVGSNPARDATCPCSRMSDDATNVVSVVQFHPGTLLLSRTACAPGLRSQGLLFDSARERCECRPPVGR